MPNGVQDAPEEAWALIFGEVRIVGEVEGLDDIDGEVARGHHLDLALHRLFVERNEARVASLVGGRRGKSRFVVLDEDACFRREQRPDHG